MSSQGNPSSFTKRLRSPLTWHYAGFAMLLVAVVVLSIRFGLDWRATNDSSTSDLSEKQVQLKALDLRTAPLRGLDKRVQESRAQMSAFYAKRIPPNYSSIDRRIGELALKGPVRLTSVKFTQGKPGSELTEISMDAGISGDYPQIKRFVNGLERDENFFVIRGLTLTGQQSGSVNLRIQVSTWLKPLDAAASGLPFTPEPGETTAATSKGKGGE